MASEMTVFTTGNRQVNLWSLYESAAKFMYGGDIELLKTPSVIQALNNLCFTVRVETADKNIVEKTRTTVDITTKEYTNQSAKEVDETLIKVGKNCNTSKANQYHFHPTNGVSWGTGSDIGAKVMGLSMSGGTAIVGGMYSNYYSSNKEFNADFHFSYQQEEKIQVPPMSRVKVTITSQAIKYEQGYTLCFSIPASYLMQVCYKTSFNRMCCGSQTGYITAGLMFQSLPSYREQDGIVYFYQKGILSWMGDGRQVDKKIESIGSVDLLQ